MVYADLLVGWEVDATVNREKCKHFVLGVVLGRELFGCDLLEIILPSRLLLLVLAVHINRYFLFVFKIIILLFQVCLIFADLLKMEVLDLTIDSACTCQICGSNFSVSYRGDLEPY